MMDLWKSISSGTPWALLLLVVLFWAFSSSQPGEEPREVRLLAGEGGNVNQEEEMERCFRERLAQEVQQMKSKYEDRLAEVNACHARKDKKIRTEKDELSAELRTAHFRIDQQSGLISGISQKIAKLRGEIARRDKEALGEQQPIVAQQKEKIQQLTALLQAEQGQHQADIDYAEYHYRELWQQLQQANQEPDQLRQKWDEAVQERNQAMQERDWAVQEMSKAVQEQDQALQKKDQALQQVVNDRQDDQAVLDNKCAQLQQERDEAICKRGDIEQKCREALQEKDRALKQVQQAREDDQALWDSSYSKLQQNLDQAVKERDQVVQEKDREQQGRMEDRAIWNSSHAQLVEERDQAVQNLDKLKQASRNRLGIVERGTEKLRERLEEEKARWNSTNEQLQQKEDLVAQLSSRLNVSEERIAVLETGRKYDKAELDRLGSRLFQADIASVNDSRELEFLETRRQELEAECFQLRHRVNELESLRGLRQARPRMDGIRRRPTTGATNTRRTRRLGPTAETLWAELAGLQVGPERQEPEEELPVAGGNSAVSGGPIADRDEANGEAHGEAHGDLYGVSEDEDNGEASGAAGDAGDDSDDDAMDEVMGDARGQANGDTRGDSEDESNGNAIEANVSDESEDEATGEAIGEATGDARGDAKADARVDASGESDDSNEL